MFRRLLNLHTRPLTAAIPARVPEGVRVYVIGDIHERADLLDHLHGLIDAYFARARSETVQIIYLGDYVDRGPDSAGVLERLATRRADFIKVGSTRKPRGAPPPVSQGSLDRFSLAPTGRDLLRSYGVDVATRRILST
jgi:hypothetical protein